MTDRLIDTPPDPGRLTRRQWMIGSVLGAIGAAAARGGEDSKGSNPDQAREVAAILERARAAKLPGFEVSESEHYLGIGDSRAGRREGALKICEGLAKAYLRHFKDAKFAVEVPDRRLIVVALKDRRAYTAFLGDAPGADAGGHYDLDSNALVIFDFREDDDEQIAANAARLNTFTLVHEAIHQLTYNTGLLDRRGDVPECISEGLAMYGELWQLPTSKRHPILGGVNKARRDVLIEHLAQGKEWFPVKQLLTDDDLFSGEDTEQLAYAESWLLVHHLMSGPKRRKFRAYLEAIRGRRDDTQRIADAEAHLGNLAALDDALSKYLGKL